MSNLRSLCRHEHMGGPVSGATDAGGGNPRCRGGSLLALRPSASRGARFPCPWWRRWTRSMRSSLSISGTGPRSRPRWDRPWSSARNTRRSSTPCSRSISRPREILPPPRRDPTDEALRPRDGLDVGPSVAPAEGKRLPGDARRAVGGAPQRGPRRDGARGGRRGGSVRRDPTGRADGRALPPLPGPAAARPVGHPAARGPGGAKRLR